MERADEPVQVGTAINKALFDDIYYEIKNPKTPYILESNTINVAANITGITTKEYEIDDIRLLMIFIKGTLGSRTIDNVIFFDTSTNSILYMFIYNGSSDDYKINNHNVLATTISQNLAPYNSSNYSYHLNLKRIEYSQDSKILSIDFENYSKTSTGYEASFVVSIYGISNKI